MGCHNTPESSRLTSHFHIADYCVAYLHTILKFRNSRQMTTVTDVTIIHSRDSVYLIEVKKLSRYTTTVKLSALSTPLPSRNRKQWARSACHCDVSEIELKIGDESLCRKPTWLTKVPSPILLQSFSGCRASVKAADSQASEINHCPPIIPSDRLAAPHMMTLHA